MVEFFKKILIGLFLLLSSLFSLSFIVSLLFLMVLAALFWAWISFAPWVPTRKRDLKRIFQLAELKEGERVYELGFGDGRFILEAVKKYKVKGFGVEIIPIFYFYVWFKSLFLKNRKDLVLKCGNLFNVDLSSADLVYFWGMPETIEKKLKSKLERELKPGCRVISYVFEIKGWKPDKVSKLEKEVPIFLYSKKN
ncbi:MAG: hypothetical protein ACPLZH_01985 [Minisyncoccales bacterium]